MRFLIIGILIMIIGVACASSPETVTPTPNPISEPALIFEPTPTFIITPTFTPTPTPDPRKEWEKIYFPVLDELRSIPGNEHLQLDWELKDILSGTWGKYYEKYDKVRYSAIYIKAYGINVIPVSLLFDTRQLLTLFHDGGAYGFFKPDGRSGFSCYANGYSSTCIRDGDKIIVENPEEGIYLVFHVELRLWDIDLPPWPGELPPNKGKLIGEVLQQN